MFFSYTCMIEANQKKRLVCACASSGSITAVPMDTMSPDQYASRKCRNPFCSPDFPSGDQARGTREIVTSRTSPRTLLLHIPLTDPLRRIYHLADSRSGTLESPAGRFFDASVVGSMKTARPPLSLLDLSQHPLFVSGLLS